MTVVLRLVQEVAPGDWEAYLEIERRFLVLESWPGAARPRRSRPLVSGEPLDVLIWEAEFESAAEAIAGLAAQANDEEHGRLFALQASLIARRRVELFEVVDLVATGDRS
jgi:hypothetical protein